MKDLIIVFVIALALGSALNSYKWASAPPSEPGAPAATGTGGPGQIQSGAPSALNTGSGQITGSAGGSAATTEAVGVTTDSTFEKQVLKANTPVLVDFFATWCGPCKAIEPVIDEIANENKGRLKVYKLDIDDNERVAGMYTDGSIPTFCLFENGKVVQKIVGAPPKSILVEAINKVCGSYGTDGFSSAPQPGNHALPPPTLTNATTAKNEDIPLIDEVGFDRDVIKSASPVLIFFCDGSEACSRTWPIVESVANKVYGKYRVVRVDVSAHPTIAQDYYVAAVPAFAIFRDGKRYKQLSGAVPEQDLLSFLEVQRTASAANSSTY
jgi:thioredoxin 1